MVRYVRRNSLVPMPSYDSFVALNAHLEERCLERMEAKLRGHTETIGERMERDLDALLPLPVAPYDSSDRHTTHVSSLSLVRYRTNDYSVPVARPRRRVLVYATHTGTRDITERMDDILTRHGFRVAVMKADAVAPERREAWVADKIKQGIDVMICHPRLVQTGLDLIDFPTLCWGGTDDSVYVMRQAS